MNTSDKELITNILSEIGDYAFFFNGLNPYETICKTMFSLLEIYKMNKFTEGPYEADEYGCMVWAEDKKMLVAEIRGWGRLTGKGIGGLGLSPDEAYEIQKSNTRLLAAAPEMYEELSYLIYALKEYNNDTYNVDIPDWRDAEKLLARIDGEEKE